MDEIALTRYRDKNPPAKATVETRQIRARVINDERRSKKMRMTEAQVRQKLSQDLPKMEAFIADCDREIALSEIRTDEVRLTQAEDLNEKAMRLSRAEGIDYTAALRKIVRTSGSGSGAGEPSVQEVEDYAKEHDLEFGDALRDLMSDRQIHDQSFNTTGGGHSFTESEMREATERRMALDKKNYRDR